MRIHRFIRPLVLALMLACIPALSFGGVFVSVSIGPPPIPVYTQPLCPGEGYIWTPGYWAWGDDGYYWVPGTWAMAPQPGLLWTPGFWGYEGGAYLWHGGYWGPHVGWYGGINYGFGYIGHGYEGGEWRGNRFYYNRTVNNVNVTHITNVYNKTVIVNNRSRVSYNGGNGGIHAAPNARDRQWQNERHIEPTHNQMEHQQFAAQNRELRAANNHGRPAIAATDRPGDFKGHVVGARAAGGPVSREALNATPRNMPAPRENRGANAAPRPDARGGNNAAARPEARGAANVPRPNANNERGKVANSPREANGGRNVPRPNAAPTRQERPSAGMNSPRNEGPSRQMNSPQEQRGGGRPMNNQREANAPRQSAPAPHASAPQPQREQQQRGGGAPHSNAQQARPQQGGGHEGGQHGGGDHPKR
jgi:hypothetical protein